MQQRTQRVQRFTSFDFTPGIDRDVQVYTPNGNGFSLEIYPRLSTGFPNFSVSLKTKVKAPPAPYHTRGGLLHLEIENQEYYVVCYGLGDMHLYTDKHLPDSQYQCLAIVADKSGTVKNILCGPYDNYGDDGAQFAHYAVRRMTFDKTAKPLDFKAMRTEVEKINEHTLQHHFNATVALPGGAAVHIRRPVKEIRQAGKNPDSNFQFWVFGYSWQIGNKVAFIGQDSLTDRFHGQVFENGVLELETNSSDFIQNLMSVSSVLFS